MHVSDTRYLVSIIHLVWGCSWHSSANVLATASMDHTIRIWDVTGLVYSLTFTISYFNGFVSTASVVC